MTATVHELRTEAAGIARRRADAIAQHPSNRSHCPPHAALLHRVAALITSEDLPPAHISVNGRNVLVDLTGDGLVQNGVRRWAAALDLLVTEVTTDINSRAHTLWSASGWDGTNTWWHVAGAEPVPA